MKTRRSHHRIGSVGNRNRVCATCGKHSDRRTCVSAAPCLGSLSLARFENFASFLGSAAGQQRRFLAGCFDVRRLARWMLQLAQRKATGLIVLVAVVAFRSFNRESTYRVLRPCVSPKTVAWNKLVQRMDDAEKALHKPFARPVAARTFGKQPYGDDVVVSAVVSLRAAYARPGFKKAGALLAGKIETPRTVWSCYVPLR